MYIRANTYLVEFTYISGKQLLYYLECFYHMYINIMPNLPPIKYRRFILFAIVKLSNTYRYKSYAIESGCGSCRYLTGNALWREVFPVDSILEQGANGMLTVNQG